MDVRAGDFDAFFNLGLLVIGADHHVLGAGHFEQMPGRARIVRERVKVEIPEVDAFAVHRFDLGIGIIELGDQIESRLAAHESVTAPLPFDPGLVQLRLLPHGMDDGFRNDMAVSIDAFHRFILLVDVESLAACLT